MSTQIEILVPGPGAPVPQNYQQPNVINNPVVDPQVGAQLPANGQPLGLNGPNGLPRYTQPT